MEGVPGDDGGLLLWAMREALSEAERARACDEVPVGCVLLNANGEIIGRGHNATNATCDPTQHAEVVALAPLLSSSARIQQVGLV